MVPVLSASVQSVGYFYYLFICLTTLAKTCDFDNGECTDWILKDGNIHVAHQGSYLTKFNYAENLIGFGLDESENLGKIRKCFS